MASKGLFLGGARANPWVVEPMEKCAELRSPFLEAFLFEEVQSYGGWQVHGREEGNGLRLVLRGLLARSLWISASVRSKPSGSGGASSC